jgi:hypothetical protein
LKLAMISDYPLTIYSSSAASSSSISSIVISPICAMRKVVSWININGARDEHAGHSISSDW